MIPAAKSRPLVAPAPAPILPLLVSIIPPAGKSFNRFGGIASGSSATYPDLNAYLWYVGSGGFDARPAQHGSVRRLLKDSGDNDRRRKL